MTVPMPAELVQPDLVADEFVDYITGEILAVAERDGVEPEAVVMQMRADCVEADTGPRRWSIDNDNAAEWAMRQCARAQATIDGHIAQAQEWAAQIDAWLNDVTKAPVATRAFFEPQLEQYAIERRGADEKNNKTTKLPSGVVKTTSSSPSVKVADEAKVVAWADDKLPKATAEKVAATKRQVYVAPLRDECTIVDVVTVAAITDEDGMVVIATLPGFHDFDGDGIPVEIVDTIPAAGETWRNPTVNRLKAVAEVEVRASYQEVHGPDGTVVPGVVIDPGGVTAKVVIG